MEISTKDLQAATFLLDAYLKFQNPAETLEPESWQNIQAQPRNAKDTRTCGTNSIVGAILILFMLACTFENAKSRSCCGVTCLAWGNKIKGGLPTTEVKQNNRGTRRGSLD